MAKNGETQKTKLSEMSSSELIDYMKMVNIMCDYYDNEAKANHGEYYGDEKERYTEATNKFVKYLNVKDAILSEIENRVNGIC